MSGRGRLLVVLLILGVACGPRDSVARDAAEAARPASAHSALPVAARYTSGTNGDATIDGAVPTEKVVLHGFAGGGFEATRFTSCDYPSIALVNPDHRVTVINSAVTLVLNVHPRDRADYGIVVRRPDGLFECTDSHFDSREAVEEHRASATPGTYDVWIGSRATQRPAYALAVTAVPMEPGICSGPELQLGNGIDVTIDGAPSRERGSCQGQDGAEQQYLFVAPRAGRYRFRTEPSGPELDTVLYVRATCAGQELGCNDDTEGVYSTVVAPLESGAEAFVFVDTFDAAARGTARLVVELVSD